MTATHVERSEADVSQRAYARAVGGRLRRVRVDRGMSLQDVERESGGRWKAAVLGSYERGDRNITAARLCELAEFYGVPPSEVLPRDEIPRPSDRPRSLALDLTRLELTDSWSGLRYFCESIQVERGDFNRQVLSIRADDLRALAAIMRRTPEELVDEIRAEGLLLEA